MGCGMRVLVRQHILITKFKAVACHINEVSKSCFLRLSAWLREEELWQRRTTSTIKSNKLYLRHAIALVTKMYSLVWNEDQTRPHCRGNLCAIEV